MNKTLIFLILLATSACGLEKAPNTQRENQSTAETVQCATQTCNAVTQYCVLTSQNNQIIGDACLTQPSPFSGCANAVADARVQFQNSNNCLGQVECVNLNNASVVTCFAP